MEEIINQAVSLVPSQGISYSAWLDACRNAGIYNIDNLVPAIRQRKVLSFSVTPQADGTVTHVVRPA